MQQKISFGIGCFHFGYYPLSTSDSSGADYVRDLEEALKKITNIEDINIEADEHFDAFRIVANNNFCALDEGYEFFPFPQCDLHVQFTLFIPDRVQKELATGGHLQASGCERFLVDIVYTYYFPITLIRAINPTDDFDPSEGVFLTRKFLEGCISCGQESTIRFESLGPSPFHSNFTLLPDQSVSGKNFSHQTKSSYAYNSHIFKYDASYFENIDDAFEELLFFNLDDQIGLFYQITHSMVLHNRDWIEYFNRVQTIIMQHKAKGFKAFWHKTFRAQDYLHDAMIDLAQIESSDLEIKYNYKKEISSLYTVKKEPELIDCLNNSLSELANLPTRQMKDILDILEHKREKNINLIMMAVSAMLGGTAGAWLTFILK